jgi:mannose-6-phosphate isomerase
MAEIYKLHNQIKHYEWGSKYLIQEFLGLKKGNGQPDGSSLPYAEMWMGTHVSAPSMAETGNDSRTGAAKNMVSLSELTGGGLPFLFKLLAVEKPLSIQAHPNQAQALKGFERENKAGAAYKAGAVYKAGAAYDERERSYKDPNHKPEILCAVFPFTLMAGFRQPEKIYSFFKTLMSVSPEHEGTIAPLLRALEGYPEVSLSGFFHALFKLEKTGVQKIGRFILENDSPNETLSECWKLMRDFAALYPLDAGILSPLYLNVLKLNPGQAVFIPAGILHSYIQGFGVELMANSDNVLRGGLTPKYVDTNELINILDFSPFLPQIVTPPAGDSSSWFCYPVPCEEFSLYRKLNGGGSNAFLKDIFLKDSLTDSQAICLVTEGEIHINGENLKDLTFKKGESFFLSRREKDASLSFDGSYSLFAAAAKTSKTGVL